MSIEIGIQPRDLRWKSLLRPYCKTVRAACGAALASAKLKSGEMTVVLADDAFMRELNKTYGGKDRPTNVLSFPDGTNGYLGDVILALETIEREAGEQGKRFRDHAAHMLVHGTLHLLGHDHIKDKEAEIMERLEIKILKKLNVSNPYL